MRVARRFLPPAFRIESDRTYSSKELIDLAEAHNPEKLVAWESARAQAAALGIALSDLFPTLATVALTGVVKEECEYGLRFRSAQFLLGFFADRVLASQAGTPVKKKYRLAPVEADREALHMPWLS